MIQPDHVFINGDYKIPHHVAGHAARAWHQQFPDDAFSHIEWPQYAWPGGYPIAYLVKDAECLCGKCANDHILRTIDPDDDQFYIVAAGIVDNADDDNDLPYCAHCNKSIGTIDNEGCE